MEIMNTDTPETDQAERESIAAYIEAYGPDALFPCDGYDHARKLERERDQWRNEHDRVVREFQHRLTVIGISVIDATSYPENVDVEARSES